LALSKGKKGRDAWGCLETTWGLC